MQSFMSKINETVGPSNSFASEHENEAHKAGIRKWLHALFLPHIFSIFIRQPSVALNFILPDTKDRRSFKRQVFLTIMYPRPGHEFREQPWALVLG